MIAFFAKMSNNKLTDLSRDFNIYKNERNKVEKIYWEEKTTIDRLVDDLGRGTPAITSTDTVLGLLACVRKEGLELLNTIKGRDISQSNLILVSSIKKAEKFIKIPSNSFAEKLSLQWPAPLTIIGLAQESVPSYACSFDRTVAVRVPDHEGLQNLLVHFDGLFSTSANMHGCPIPTSIEEIDQKIAARMPYVVVDRAKLVYPAISSTIVDCTRSDLRIVRQGVFDIASFEIQV